MDLTRIEGPLNCQWPVGGAGNSESAHGKLLQQTQQMFTARAGTEFSTGVCGANDFKLGDQTASCRVTAGEPEQRGVHGARQN